MTPSAKSYCHRGGEAPLLGETIPEHFAHIVKQFPAQEAVISIHQQRRMTYREMARGIDKLARDLLGTGFDKGDRIGVWSTNNIEAEQCTALHGVPTHVHCLVGAAGLIRI